ncbi:hypothetical protein StoSoilB13_12330 [Arthrobacter sp. StoSoilB13]|nr:hypothetical protein StoSoilB13_12330 [Arthrobacter sp. StoSoilB13]
MEPVPGDTGTLELMEPSGVAAEPGDDGLPVQAASRAASKKAAGNSTAARVGTNRQKPLAGWSPAFTAYLPISLSHERFPEVSPVTCGALSACSAQCLCP